MISKGYFRKLLFLQFLIGTFGFQENIVAEIKPNDVNKSVLNCPSQSIYYINRTTASLRASPSINSAKTAQIPNGSRICALEKNEWWTKISYNENTTGWILDNFLEDEEDHIYRVKNWGLNPNSKREPSLRLTTEKLSKKISNLISGLLQSNSEKEIISNPQSMAIISQAIEMGEFLTEMTEYSYYSVVEEKALADLLSLYDQFGDGKYVKPKIERTVTPLDLALGKHEWKMAFEIISKTPRGELFDRQIFTSLIPYLRFCEISLGISQGKVPHLGSFKFFTKKLNSISEELTASNVNRIIYEYRGDGEFLSTVKVGKVVSISLGKDMDYGANGTSIVLINLEDTGIIQPLNMGLRYSYEMECNWAHPHTLKPIPKIGSMVVNGLDRLVSGIYNISNDKQIDLIKKLVNKHENKKNDKCNNNINVAELNEANALASKSELTDDEEINLYKLDNKIFSFYKPIGRCGLIDEHYHYLRKRLGNIRASEFPNDFPFKLGKRSQSVFSKKLVEFAKKNKICDRPGFLEYEKLNSKSSGLTNTEKEAILKAEEDILEKMNSQHHLVDFCKNIKLSPNPIYNYLVETKDYLSSGPYGYSLSWDQYNNKHFSGDEVPLVKRIIQQKYELGVMLSSADEGGDGNWVYPDDLISFLSSDCLKYRGNKQVLKFIRAKAEEQIKALEKSKVGKHFSVPEGGSEEEIIRVITKTQSRIRSVVNKECR